MIEAVFFIAIATIGWVYLGYPLFLWLAASSKGREVAVEQVISDSEWPLVTVVIPVFNEGAVIERRLRNLVDLDYPPSKLEIVVGSDGSTDDTVAAVGRLDDLRVRIIAFSENRGREAVHNDLIPAARGNLVVITDADTRFDRDFVKRCAALMISDPTIGCVVGKLRYRSMDSAIAQFEGLYWRYDLAMKEWESRIGLIHNGSGPCQMIRRSLYRGLRPGDDVDATTVLDILLQGYSVKFLPSAIAYDLPPASAAAELKGRIRQTSRSYVSGLRKWTPRLWIRHPALTVAFFSHRILRWSSPYLFLIAFVSSAALASRSRFFLLAFVLQVALWSAALVGWLLESLNVRVPIVSTIFSFGVANLGMAIGIARGLIGKVPRGYQMPADPVFDD